MLRALFGGLIAVALLTGCAKDRCCAPLEVSALELSSLDASTWDASLATTVNTPVQWQTELLPESGELLFPLSGNAFVVATLPRASTDKPAAASSADDQTTDTPDEESAGVSLRPTVGLTGKTICSQAAAAAPVANALAAQRRAWLSCPLDDCSRAELNELYRLAEFRERQLAATEAAERLIQLARLQGQQQLLEETQVTLEQALLTVARFAELQPAEVDATPLRLQQVELDTQTANLESGFVQAQSRLRQLCGLPPERSQPLRVRELPEWTPLPPQQELLELALRSRTDLALTTRLQQLLHSDNTQASGAENPTTWELNPTLSSTHPLLGLQSSSVRPSPVWLRWLGFPSASEEPRCPELSGLRHAEAEQRREIAREATSAIAAYEAQHLKLTAARQRVSIWETRREELETLGELRNITADEWFTAQLRLLEARSLWLDAACDLELKRVELERVLGRWTPLSTTAPPTTAAPTTAPPTSSTIATPPSANP